MDPFSEVAIGVLKNVRGDVLVSKRKAEVDYGGLWELPGGKKKKGETTDDTLKRELKEEVGIEVERSRRLIKLEHVSRDQRLELNVFEIIDWSGIPCAMEGQEIKWLPKEELSDLAFPALNSGINTAIFLPSVISVTAPFSGDIKQYTDEIVRLARNGIELIHIRPLIQNYKSMTDLTSSLAKRSELLGATLMINCKLSYFDEKLFDGLHLNRIEAAKYQSRPIAKSRLFSTSCHNLEELEHAERIEADFIYISPVKKTVTHSNKKPLGWAETKAMVERSLVPVYALGGLSCEDVISAKEIGCQGIALKSALWNMSNQREILELVPLHLRELERSYRKS